MLQIKVKILTVFAWFLLMDMVFGLGKPDDLGVFSTKTAYDWVHNYTSFSWDEDYEFSHQGKQCKAVHVNMVVKHGARWPSDSNMEHIEDLHKRIKENLQTPMTDIQQHVYDWTTRYQLSDDTQLAEHGKMEQKHIGQNLWSRFGTLFQSYGKDYVKLISSSKQRAIDSVKKMHEGFYDVTNEPPTFAYEQNDTLTRFYDGCEKYETMVEDNQTNFKEMHDFEKTDYFKDVIASVKSHLGPGISISNEDLYQIFNLCAYEMYLFGDNYVWCDLLTAEQRRVVEYSIDVENYYEGSYGHPLNSVIVCPLVNDMLDTMEAAHSMTRDYNDITEDDAEGYLAAKIYVGHTGTTLHLLTALGLYKDDMALKGSNYNIMANRLFRTSYHSTASANIAFVLYACDHLQNDDRSFMVKLFVNEKPAVIPACGKEMCDYDVVMDHYGNMRGDKCNLEELCKLDPVSHAVRHAPGAFLTSVFILCIAYYIF